MSAIVLDGPWAGQTFTPPTPLDIATLENAIVNQLQSQITAIEIVHFPDQPAAYRLTHRTGAALVVYRGATYGEPADTAVVVQERKLEFEVTLMVRDLGWSVGGDPGGTSPGAYALLELIRATLTGFQIPGCSKLRPQRERFVQRDREGGLWIYAITFVMTTAAVEPSTIDGFPLLITAIAQEQGGITTTTLGAAPYNFGSNGQIQLPNVNLAAITVSAAESGAPYIVGIDYTIDTVNGILSLTPASSIPNGALVEIAYSFSETVTAKAGGTSAPTAPSN